MTKLDALIAPFSTVVLLFIGLVVYGILFGPLTLTVGGGDSDRTFTVVGEGRVEATPDTFTTTFSVEEQGDTQEVAQQLGNNKQNQALDALKELGFEEDNIQTTQYNIRENYDFTQGREVVTGYTFTQSTQVETDNRESLQNALDTLAGIGINIGGISLEVDEDKYQVEARKAAVKDARQKAEELAEAGGFRVGKLASISEGTTPGGPIPLPALENRAVEELDQSIISPGQNEIVRTVSVTYYIK